MPKNFPGSFGPKVGGAVIEAAAERGQARSLAAMLAANPLVDPQQLQVEALAAPALRDPYALFAAAGVDRLAVEADFAALRAQLQHSDPAAQAALVEAFDARWGKALARVQAHGGAAPVAAPAPSAGPEGPKDYLVQSITSFFLHREGGDGDPSGAFDIPSRSAWVAGSTRAAVAFGGETLLRAGLTELSVRASFRLDTGVQATTVVAGGYASAGATARLYARISAMDDSWHRDFSPRIDPFAPQVLTPTPREIYMATYTPAAGTGSYAQSPIRLGLLHILAPVPEPTMLTVWVVLETWATAGGLATASVGRVAGRVEEIRVNGV